MTANSGYENPEKIATRTKNSGFHSWLLQHAKHLSPPLPRRPRVGVIRRPPGATHLDVAHRQHLFSRASSIIIAARREDKEMTLVWACNVIIFCSLLAPAHAFLFATFKWQTALTLSRQNELLLDDVRSSLSAYTLLRMAGGWGKRKKELTPEESARGDGVSGERRGFDAYELQVRL
jgi:hypothetical protein